VKVKKNTITIDQLNNNVYTEVDCLFTDSLGNSYYPSSIFIENVTNCDLGILFISDTEEKVEITKYSDYYEYLEVPSNKSTVDLPLANQFIRIKKVSGTAIADLIFYTYNYSTKKLG
jgi:hypothetical protein